jgi:predicted nucleotidyltransferase
MGQKTDKKIVDIIRRFVESLRVDIPVDAVFLFGSYARGEARSDSDIDLVVVSSAFNAGTNMANMQYLFRKAVKVSSLLEPIPATPAEVKRPGSRHFLKQVLPTARMFTFA